MLTVPLKKWVTGRPPILEATRALGLSDQRVAQLMGISQQAVQRWANGTDPIPHARHLALWWMVNGLIEYLAAPEPPEDPKYARRVAAACRAAGTWAELAYEELEEKIGSTPDRQLVAQASDLRDQLVEELVRRGLVEGSDV